ncbi:MAG TPA: hypothetical protein VGH28_27065 [Polyangiaceae bacterium]
MLRRSPHEEEELPEPEEDARPNYRVAGDLPMRAAELEQRVAEMTADMKRLEHEVYATRHAMKRYRALHAVSTAGIGALLGAVIGTVIWAFADMPAAIVVAMIIGCFLGFLAGGRWVTADDNFPKPPPPTVI